MDACERYELFLSARLDGELSPEESVELEAHLAQCPACRALAAELEAAHSAFAQLDELAAPPEFAQDVMKRIRAQEGTERSAAGEEKAKVIPLFRRPQVRALVSLAACAAVCMGVYQAGLLQPAEHNLDSSYSAFMAATSADEGVQSAQAGDGQTPSIQQRAVAPDQEEEAAPEGQDTVSSDGTESEESKAQMPTTYAVTGSANVQAQTTQTEGTAQPEVTLTLVVLPQGAEAVLGESVQWQSDELGQRWCLITAAQMQALIALAQEEGQELGDVPAVPTDQNEMCALIMQADG